MCHNCKKKEWNINSFMQNKVNHQKTSHNDENESGQSKPAKYNNA